MKMKTILFSAFFSFILISASAQEPAILAVKDLHAHEVPVRVSDVQIDIKVVGSLAVTTVDMTFYNPNNRILEGELQFPLAEGQSVSRFALDINGKLRESVVVEKAKGQQVFESTVRSNVDPGLLEKTQGNNFKTRIYPLPAKGSRRVVIAYEQELFMNNGKYRFFLPIEYRDTLADFRVHLTVFGKEQLPSVEQTPWGNFAFHQSGKAYVASFSAKNYPAKGQLVFSVPVKEEIPVYVEKGKISDQTVFYAQVFPKVESRPKKQPQVIDLYWDASGSMSKRNLNLETDLLDRYFKQINTVTVHFHFFNCLVDSVQTFPITNGNWDALKSALQNTVYDGATQLGKLNLAASQADEILLFSDGLSNLGDRIPELGAKAVSVINSSLSADYSLLKYLAETSGGQFVNLLQQSPENALNSLMNENYRLISHRYEYTTDRFKLKPIVDFASSGAIIHPESGFSFAGIVNTDSITIRLDFGIGNEVLESKRITVNKNKAADYGNLLERIWAEKKISELDLLYDKNKEAIEALGRKYTIVTRNTSLIVLDNVRDYIEYNITPPEELLEEYNQLMAEEDAEIDSDEPGEWNAMDNVYAQFNERQEWWNKSFPSVNASPPPLEEPLFDDVDSQSTITVAGYKENSVEVVDLKNYVIVDYENNAPDETESVPPPPMLEEVIQFTPPVLALEGIAAGVDSRTNLYSDADIALNDWQPDVLYLQELKELPDIQLYPAYLQCKAGYEDTPSFFLDVASLFEERGLLQETFIILSNLVELKMQDYRLMRVLAHRLQRLGYIDYAIDQFQAVLELRPEEPQSYRDLALAYEQKKEYQKAIDLFYQIVEDEWDDRFPNIETIAIEEMNHCIYWARQDKITLDLQDIAPEFISLMPVDIRIILNWDTDNTDMDLWVTDPYGEKCYYENTLTHIGGRISNDFTDGYGPEEFLIREAIKGKYTIEANYYGSHEQTLTGPTTVYLDIFTYYLTDKEKKQTIMLRLTEEEALVKIGEITFEKAGFNKH
jgi:tetratricopeptide (TPR) repeat protein